MNTAHKLTPQPLPHLVHDQEPELCDADVKSLRPSGEYPTVRPQVAADDDLDVWTSQKRAMKRRAWLVCLAFPMTIGAVLFSISGEGRPKDLALRVLSEAVAVGETVQFAIKREAAELAEAKAEIAAAEKAAREARKKRSPL